MRGKANSQPSMLLMGTVEDRVPKTHPLRGIKRLADDALKSMDARFDEIYSDVGRPSIPPERLLKGQLLIALFSIRSERQLCEQLEYNMLFRWFLDMDLVEPVFDATSFTQNRDRLLGTDASYELLKAVVELARNKNLMSADHFSVDGTLIEAWASHKSFRPKGKDGDDDDNNGWSNFRGEKRSNETHESKTDPDSKLARKSQGQAAKLSYSAHALMENRNGLIVDFEVAPANGTAERTVALEMVQKLSGGEQTTLGADKGYDTADFIAAIMATGVAPHVARNQSANRRSSVPSELAETSGYAVSLIIRRRIEQIFGWMKEVGGFRRTRFRGRPKVRAQGQLVAAAYNLLRIAKLLEA